MRIVRPIVRTLGDMGAVVKNMGRLREVATILVRHGYGSLVKGVPGVETRHGRPEHASGVQDRDVLYVIDIRDPTAPELMGGWAPGGRSVLFDVEVVDGTPWVNGILGEGLARAVALDFDACAR